jgi:Spy/CpxP family protein refolding chaperone
MKPQAYLVAAVALIVAASAAAEAPPAPKKPEPARAMSNDAALMIAECKLTEEQKARLFEVSNASLKAITAWHQANGPKLAALEKALAAAREAGNAEEAAKIQAEGQALVAQRKALVTKGQQAVLEVLTPPQRLSWVAFQAYRQMMLKLQAANPTPLQAAKCRAMCREIAPELAGINTEEEEGARARALLLQKTFERVIKEVLTPEQQAALPKEPPTTPADAPPPTDEKPAPKEASPTPAPKG